MELIIMSGKPGSGKSTRALKVAAERGGIKETWSPWCGKKHLTLKGKNVVIASADSYWMNLMGKYVFDKSDIAQAHQFCQDQVFDAMELGAQTIIVDNTNTRCWEARPYLVMMNDFNEPGFHSDKGSGYKVSFMESDCPWKDDPVECHRRCTKDCPLEVIQRMHDQREELTVEAIMMSRAPWER